MIVMKTRSKAMFYPRLDLLMLRFRACITETP